MQSQWLPVCQISVWFFCGSILEPTWGLWDSQELKGKNKQIEPGEASRDIFRHRSKQFWAFCLLLHALSFQLYHDELKVELDVLFSRLHFVLLAAFDSSFPDLDMKKLIVLPPICSFPGFRLPFGSTAGNVVIDRFLSCKVVEELMKCVWFCFGKCQGCGSACVTAMSCVVLVLLQPAGSYQEHPALILPENTLFLQLLVSDLL